MWGLRVMRMVRLARATGVAVGRAMGGAMAWAVVVA